MTRPSSTLIFGPALTHFRHRDGPTTSVDLYGGNHVHSWAPGLTKK